MYVGPPIDDAAILEQIPAAYRRLLENVNGYIAYHGGLHVRGACLAPEWHSLRAAWLGPRAIHRLYPSVTARDIPFAQDALGDQFLVRDGIVHRLNGETGEVASLSLDLAGFDAAARENPVEYLGLEPLERFRADGNILAPGQLLSVMPPFCMEESAQGVSLRAVAMAERIQFLADLAAQLSDVPDGVRVTFRAG